MISWQQKQEKEWFATSFRAENFIPGLVIGFIFGMLLDLSKPAKSHAKKKNFLPGKPQEHLRVPSNGDQDLKMVCSSACLVIFYLICSNVRNEIM